MNTSAKVDRSKAPSITVELSSRYGKRICSDSAAAKCSYQADLMTFIDRH